MRTYSPTNSRPTLEPADSNRPDEYSWCPATAHVDTASPCTTRPVLPASDELGLGASLAPRSRTGSCNTGLLLAARMGETKVMEWLLAEGSDVSYRNLAGSTALLRAVTMNRRRAVRLLLKAGADPDQANRRGVVVGTVPIQLQFQGGSLRTSRQIRYRRIGKHNVTKARDG